MECECEEVEPLRGTWTISEASAGWEAPFGQEHILCVFWISGEDLEGANIGEGEMVLEGRGEGKKKLLVRTMVGTPGFSRTPKS